MSSAAAAPPERVVPGSLLQVAGLGVLLSGESGSGKSDTVLGLLDRGHRLVADDAVRVFRHGESLWGAPPPGLEGMLAVRSLGVLDVATLFGAEALLPDSPIELVIHLCPAAPQSDALAVRQDSRTIMTTRLPRLTLATGHGRDLPLLVEIAVRARRHGSQAGFIARQRRLISRGTT